jgi:thymidylate kinase
MFIVLEGPDAVGKNTQKERLALKLERLGREVVAFSFPRYKTVLGAAIERHLRKEIVVAEADDIEGSTGKPLVTREDPMVFQCMMVVDKYDAAPAIEDALGRGAVVIADRWWQSAYCYGAADGLPKEWLLRAHKRLPQADLNFWISIPPEEAFKRRPKARDRYEEDRAKQAVVRDHYNDLWGALDDPLGTFRSGRWHVIDGMQSIEKVHDDIWHHVTDHHTRRGT